MRYKWMTVVGVAAAALATGLSAQAAMSLTPAGSSAGFTLSTFVDQYPNSGIGPVGITFFGANQVMTSDYNAGLLTIFNDVDGQHFGGGTPGLSTFTGNNAAGLTTFNGTIYLALQNSARIDTLSTAGAVTGTLAAVVGSATSIVGDPNNNHLYVSSPGGGPISEVDATTGAVLDTFGSAADGLTLDSVNHVLYAEVGGHIIGYSTITHAQVFDSGGIPGSPDGCALGTGVLAGNLFVNTNGGTLVEVNISSLAQTTLATGGSRGDLVTVDPFNGTLLLTQSDSILRLTAPTGGGFGGTVPLPASVWSGLGMLASLGGCGWLKRRKRA